MKKPKNKINAKSALKMAKIKTGTVEDFFSDVKNIMRSADKGKPIKKRAVTLTFVDPTEMLHFLSTSKLKVFNTETQDSAAKILAREGLYPTNKIVIDQGQPASLTMGYGK